MAESEGFGQAVALRRIIAVRSPPYRPSPSRYLVGEHPALRTFNIPTDKEKKS